MKQRIIHFLQLLLYLLMKTWRAWLAVAVIIVGALWLRQCRDERIAAGTAFRIETSDSIDVTPEEIRAVRQIGQWEFLCVPTPPPRSWGRLSAGARRRPRLGGQSA